MVKEEYYYKCPKCKKKVEYGVKKCPNCKTKINWSEEENTREVKVNTRLGIGIALIVINLALALSETISCKNSFIQQESCSFIQFEYGLPYVVGRFIFLIIGIVLIYRWWKYPKYKEITINNEIEDKPDEEYDEDLEDMYDREEYDEDLEEFDNSDEEIEDTIEENDEEDIDENDEFFKEEFDFSYAKVKKVLKKLGYDNYATFKKEVYNSKKIKRKKFEEKEDEIDYLVKALGYDDFEDFYNENIKNK